MASRLRTAILGFSPDVYWPLDELSGTVARDISGNGRNGTFQGSIAFGQIGIPGDEGTTALGVNGQPGSPPFNGMKRAGLSDHANISIVFHFYNGASSVPISEVPFSWTGTSTDGYAAQFSSSSGLFNALLGEAGGYALVTDPEQENLFQGHWNQVVMVLNSSSTSFSLYVNGSLKGSIAPSLHGTPPTADLALFFLNQSSGALQPYLGYMGHVAIIPSALAFADIQALYDAAGIAAVTTGNVTNATLVGSSPTSYVLGTAVAGLTGSGTIAVPNLYGALVDLTTVPVSWGKTSDVPLHYIPAVGRILFSDLNGDWTGELVHNPTQLIFSPNRTNEFLRYYFRPGVTATVTPLTLA